MNLVFYLMLIGPFVVILLHILTTKNASIGQKIMGYGSFLVGLPIVLSVNSPSFPWFILLPATLGVVYATQWLSGFSSFMVVFPCMGFLCLSLATKMPGIGSPYFTYTELLYLPVNIATFVMPPQLIWHVWDRLPYVFDTLRKGNWSETGVPLLARYRFLAVIVLVSLFANLYYYSQVTNLKETLRSQVSDSRYTMFYELKQVEHILRHRKDEVFHDWHDRVTQHLSAYQSAARRVNSIVVSGGIANTSPFYFLAETLPQGLTGALWRGNPLTEDEFNMLIAVVKATVESLEANYSMSALSPAYYKKVVDNILIEASEALGIFNVQYTARPRTR